MLTITCMHCGPIRVIDPAVALATRRVLSALAVGAAPLGAITCPSCRDEVRAKDVACGKAECVEAAVRR